MGACREGLVEERTAPRSVDHGPITFIAPLNKHGPHGPTVKSQSVAAITQLYEDFNARRIEAVLDRLDVEVSWPDMINRRMVHGHAAVRSYWESRGR